MLSRLEKALVDACRKALKLSQEWQDILDSNGQMTERQTLELRLMILIDKAEKLDGPLN